MKVLYGIQCTGNGHITRSVEVINELKKHVKVDVLTSGSHSEIPLPFPTKYKLKGLSYHFGKRGGFDLTKTLSNNNIYRFMQEVKRVPTEDYDFVITDFEPVTAWSAKRNDVYCVGLSNQSTLLEKSVPTPNTILPFSKTFIKAFCPVDKPYGLSYKKYADNLFFPPIRDEIRQLKPTSENYYVVYIPFYSDKRILKIFTQLKNTQWKVFSKHTKFAYTIGNVSVQPIENELFVKSLESCAGIVCSAGFGTTSEALYLNKKLLVIPMKGQFEQKCNAKILKSLGATVLKKLKSDKLPIIQEWVTNGKKLSSNATSDTSKIVHTILNDYIVHLQAIQF